MTVQEASYAANMDPVVEPVATHDLATAAHLIAALDPMHERWGEDSSRRWIFRGQEQDWPLIPSALRPEARLPGGLLAGQPQWGSTKHNEHDEFAVLREFIDDADLAGIEIPHDSPILRDPLKMRELVVGSPSPLALMFSKFTDWPPDELLAALALAQHYGVPTRLRDWTFDPKVAAYFACANAAREAFNASPASQVPPAAAQNMVVWALDMYAIASKASRGGKLTRMAAVRAPYASNPNLAAQAGLFTLDRDADEAMGLETSLPKAVEEYVEGNGNLLTQFFAHPIL